MIILLIGICLISIISVNRLIVLWHNIFNDGSIPDISNTYVYTTKITNKEEMFQFVVNHQEELDQVVCEMVSNYGTSDDRIINIYEYDWELSALDNVNELFREISVMRISIDNMEEENQIDMLFDYAPVSYEYWGGLLF